MQVRLIQMSSPPLEMIKLMGWLIHRFLDSAPLTLSLVQWENI